MGRWGIVVAIAFLGLALVLAVYESQTPIEDTAGAMSYRQLEIVLLSVGSLILISGRLWGPMQRLGTAKFIRNIAIWAAFGLAAWVLYLLLYPNGEPG
jgi:hypothetical protein